jgi:AbrB family looped-hinge helix DNA binding protein
MDYIRKLTAKSQVTIPKDVRDALGIGPLDEVRFVFDRDGQVVLRPLDAEAKMAREDAAFEARLKEAQAIFRANDTMPGISTDEFMAMIREPLTPAEETAYRKLRRSR